MNPILGCIADDFTGATDLAGTLATAGMRVVQLLNVPDAAFEVNDVDAVVVALKTRSIEPDDAVRQSLEALEWLVSHGAERFFFKYCSTFDSTDRGNIGPVAMAFLARLGARIAIACPAFPDNQRTVYQGHLFVGDRLLNESGMEHHPLNPMTDANLVRVLAKQASARVGLVPLATVATDAEAVGARLDALADDGASLAIADAVTNEDLHTLAEACAEMPLVTGGSGIAIGLPDAYRRRGWLIAEASPPALPRVEGASAVLAGSCSSMTLRQIEFMRARCPSLVLTPQEAVEDHDAVERTLSWAQSHLGAGPVMIYASEPPRQLMASQERFGREAAGKAVESALASIANGLVERGVRRLVVAGGETSGAVVQALGIRALRIGPLIDSGVPWTESAGEPRLALALKSGNFGGEDFFRRALEMLG